jgi:hypothetical protein
MTHAELLAEQYQKRYGSAKELAEQVREWITQTQLDTSYTSDYAEFTIGAFRRVLVLIEKELG